MYSERIILEACALAYQRTMQSRTSLYHSPFAWNLKSDRSGPCIEGHSLPASRIHEHILLQMHRLIGSSLQLTLSPSE